MNHTNAMRILGKAMSIFVPSVITALATLYLLRTTHIVVASITGTTGVGYLIYTIMLILIGGGLILVGERQLVHDFRSSQLDSKTRTIILSSIIVGIGAGAILASLIGFEIMFA